MTLWMLLEMVAGAFGFRSGVGTSGRGLTYEELADRSARGGAIVGAHEARAVIYLGTTDLAFPVALFAAAWAGVPFIPLNYRLSDEQLGALLAKHPGALVVTDDLTRVTALGADVAALMDLDGFLAGTAAGPTAEELGPPAADGDDIAVLLYTSGTTSEPKAVVLRHRHLAAYVITSIEFASADDDAVALITVPPYHIAGVANTITSIYSTRRIAYLPTFSPQAWLDTVRAESVTHAFLVPTMLARVVDALDGAPAECPSIRSLSYGGARMPITVLEKALDAFGDAGFVNAYGLTETSSTLAVLTPDDHRAALAGDPVARQRLGSAGRIIPGVEVEIRDGEIWCRGEQISGEYLGLGAVTDEDGWFPTRDRGWFDDEGYLFIEGRSDDTIIRGGENIAPAEIEDVLLAHPGVADAAVVGVPDDEWGQRIEAAVVLRHDAGDLDGDALRAHCREHLRSSKTPDRIVVRAELPHTDTGKLLRRAVLADLSASAPTGGPT
ncbi:MAG: class I adenylate-forming enzyme family protein [Acidimicrobiales bacterium]